MAKTLILMRHGKAQRASEDMLDMERRLTEAGKRSLIATLPNSLGLMSCQQDSKVEVWSSPAARAEQTARLMQKACKRVGIDVDSDIKGIDALWTQDIESFCEAVKSTDSDTIIAVGHNPFIEDVTKKLTGSHIVFATGAFAAISIPKSEEEAADKSGRLLWFAQGPISQRWKTLVQMESILAEAADTIIERLEGFYNDPNDIETMHKFRVSIRTLRSLLAFTAPWQDANQNKDVQAELKEIVGETSHLRELDVLSEQAQEMEDASAELVQFCGMQAYAEREHVMKVLASKRIVKKLNHVVEELHNVKWRKRVNAEGLESAVIRERFIEVAAELEQELAQLDLADVELTHDVRKSAKRVRYDAENFKSLIGDDAVDIAKSMTTYQDDLGAICDARVNIDIINELPLEQLPEPVAWDLSLLRARNETFLYSTLRNA